MKRWRLPPTRRAPTASSPRDELRHLQVALDRSPPRHRKAIVLQRVEGLSRRAIAERMGISEATAATYLAKGICALVDILYGDPPNLPEDAMQTIARRLPTRSISKRRNGSSGAIARSGRNPNEPNSISGLVPPPIIASRFCGSISGWKNTERLAALRTEPAGFFPARGARLP